jgi:hypothetical protein
MSPTSLSAQKRVTVPGSQPGDVTHFVRILGVSDLLGVSGPPDRRINAIAAAQRGRVARVQLLSAGVTEDMIRTRVRSGSLIREHHGVYVVPGAVGVPLGRETSALLAIDRSVTSHLTAGVVYEVIRMPDDLPVHLTTRTQHRDRDGIIVHRSSTFTRADIAIHQRTA